MFARVIWEKKLWKLCVLWKIAYLLVTSRFTSLGQCVLLSSSSLRYERHAIAEVCVPCPWVTSLIGSKTKVPFFSRLLSFSAIPNSGGLMKSSAELIHIIGAVIFSSCGEGS